MKQGLMLVAILVIGLTNLAAEPINIGSRLELFVDHHVINRITGDVELYVHRPKPEEVVLVTGEPWEGNTSAYYTLFQDGDRYRMYYRGSHSDLATQKAAHPEVTCYAESRDGIHWSRPELGLYEFNGSKKNNIVWDGIGTHCFVVFKDGNPEAPAEARYKAISRGRPQGDKGLYVYQSPDGIHWSLIRDYPVITEGAFDSQNLAFWDPEIGLYREYHRIFAQGVRAIMTGTSSDFVNWTDPVLLEYPGSLDEHLYTNAVQPYPRAPHILLGFPTRYLPEEGSRVEPVLMGSHDGRSFHRWPKAVIPEDAPQDRGGNRSNYMTWGILSLPGKPKELSMYASEAYYEGPDSRLRRFSYRVDGFVSAKAGSGGGNLITKVLVFSGNRLEVNFATRPGGSIRVELQNERGRPIENYSLGDSKPLRGDSLQQTVSWKGRQDVGEAPLKGLKVRFEIKNADLYSFRFRD